MLIFLFMWLSINDISMILSCQTPLPLLNPNIMYKWDVCQIATYNSEQGYMLLWSAKKFEYVDPRIRILLTTQLDGGLLGAI